MPMFSMLSFPVPGPEFQYPAFQDLNRSLALTASEAAHATINDCTDFKHFSQNTFR